MNTDDLKKKFSGELAQLETLRGELEVKMSLAKADAKDEYWALRSKLDDAHAKLRNEIEALADASHAQDLVNDVKGGYEKLLGLLAAKS
jgi:ElaB/YqjD/DUF883 family membrane-anchored ribosome-binding protein